MSAGLSVGQFLRLVWPAEGHYCIAHPFKPEGSSTTVYAHKVFATISEAVTMNEPPSDKGRTLKIYYSTQASVQPPTFIIFVNDAEIVHFSYERYLENFLRKTFAYHCIMQSPDRTRAIEFLQRILGHSSAAITLAYAGITDEEIRSTYKKLNLGMRRVLEPTSAVFSAMPAGPAGTEERKDS